MRVAEVKQLPSMTFAVLVASDPWIPTMRKNQYALVDNRSAVRCCDL